ncbi:cupin-like domain-containing protein [Alteromonas sediminis]|uniref:Cupin-like domain-containing protein n=1 Tax=Alteromonas sediminis TaxID=2259342 RepID=A0A3N5Y4G2_9ALTE|nr:cupin-like domain-containing protein [Alteromonas sediminis]RPJ68013.1 cupin-like domain-containing protein [Alteromonas sediminis]
MTTQYKHVAEYTDLSEQQLFSEIVPAQHPVVIRDFAKSWPVVEAAKAADQTFIEYLCNFYQGDKVMLSMAPKSANRRFFYNDDLTGFTFASGEERLDRFLMRLLELKGRPDCPALSMQSALAHVLLPGFEKDNTANFFPDTPPRLWLGNQGIVDTHFDGTDNIACVIAGKRRFTLFAPDQTSNLYPGPLEVTPAGVPVSLVDLHHPDLSKYPRFEQAMQQAYQAELAPGDAIFIPMLWWHHVESLSDVNGLMNYWWNGSFAKDATSPSFTDSLKMAIFAMRNMNQQQRAAWQCMFDHYVFRQGVDPASYIPEHQLQLLGEIDDDLLRMAKEFFIEKFQQ